MARERQDEPFPAYASSQNRDGQRSRRLGVVSSFLSGAVKIHKFDHRNKPHNSSSTVIVIVIVVGIAIAIVIVIVIVIVIAIVIVIVIVIVILLLPIIRY